jgi:tetratricopeptide (TPR) repeat protein
LFRQTAMQKNLLFIICFILLTAFPAQAEKKLAVLPFEVLSQQAEFKQFGIGTTETLAAGLTNIPELVIIDRGDLQKVLKELAFQNSDFSDAETSVKIGKILGAEILVTGTIQYFDNQFRISSKFIDVQTAKLLKATTVTGPNIFELQDKLVKEFIENQGFMVSQQQQENITKIIKATDNTDAYGYYLKANDQYWKVYFDYGMVHSITLNDAVLLQREAAENFDKALGIDPNYSLALAGKAKLQAIWAYYHSESLESEKKILDAAEVTARKAMDFNPNLWEVYNTLNVIYALKEDYKSAVEFALKAYSINPHNKEVYYWLGSTYFFYAKKLMDEKYYTEAITYFSYAKQYFPEMEGAAAAYSLICEAKSLTIKNDHKNALEAYRKLLQNTYVPWLKNEGFTEDISATYIKVATEYYLENNFEKALDLYKEILMKKIETPQIYNNVGAIFYMQKDYKNASYNYERAIELDPMNPGYYQNLGDVLVLLGNQKKAVAVYKSGCNVGNQELCKYK